MWSLGRRFSARKGLFTKTIQKDDFDVSTVNLLWNECSQYLQHASNLLGRIDCYRDFCRHVWVEFFRESFDTLLVQANPRGRFGVSAIDSDLYTYVCNQAMSFFNDGKTPYNQKLDFVQHLIDYQPSIPSHVPSHVTVTYTAIRERLIQTLNNRFEQCLTNFRVVAGHVMELTDEQQIQAIESAAASTGELDNVGVHITKALSLYAQRPKPDYVNSIKESISAVECICKIIAEMPNTTLGPALDETAKRLDLNAHVVDSVKKLYKYASDAEGIRHALKPTDKGNIKAEDAMFMLVTCSAFVNLLTEKGTEYGRV